MLEHEIVQQMLLLFIFMQIRIPQRCLLLGNINRAPAVGGGSVYDLIDSYLRLVAAQLIQL